MVETTVTVRLDDELRAAFAEAAKAQGCTEAELLARLIQEEVHRPGRDAGIRRLVPRRGRGGHPRSRRSEC